MTNEEYNQRQQRIPEPIRRIALNNPIIHNISSAYIHGTILTLDEALAQMVVLLSVDWEAQQKRMYDIYAQMPPIYFPKKD